MPRKAAAAVPRKRAAPARKTAAPRKAPPPVAKKAAAKRASTPRKAAPRKATALRVVGPNEHPAVEPKPGAPITLVDAAEQGNERAMLVFLRTQLAKTITASTTPARDQASLSIRLMQINRDIQAIDARAAEEASRGDDEDIDETFNPEAL